MRTLDATLESALANQQGEVILRVLTWADATAYNAAPTVPEYTWTVKDYDLYSTEAKATLLSANDYTVSDFTVFIIERGIKLDGTEYTIQSGLMHVKNYRENYGEILIEGSSYPNVKISIPGDDTYENVITAFCAAIDKTAVFKNADDAWLGYKFLPAGKTLSLNRAELFENLIRQKYCILVYEESPNNLVFYNQDSYPNQALKSIAFNGTDQLAVVATSGSNKALTSANSTDWTPRTAPAFANALTYSPSLELFVAVGASVCHTSDDDGETWTAQTIPAGTYNALIWSDDLTLFVAVGTNVCATSPDGITWTARTVPAGNYLSVAWSSTLTLLVAIADKIITSPNGTTWTTNTAITAYDWINSNAAEGATWYSVSWSPSLGIFAAISYNATNRVMTSTDGLTWTARTAAEASSWRSIAWSPSLGMFAAVAYAGTNRVMTSTNGVDWTARSAAEANAWQAIAWSPSLGMFVAVSADGTNRVMTSTNGVDWTARSAEASSWRSITWSPSLGMFAAVAYAGTNRVMTSTNGVDWTARSAAEANQWQSVAWSPSLGMFAAVSIDGTNRVMTSTNGVDWTARSAAEANAWQAIAWSPEHSIFTAVSSNGTNRVMTSTNGVDWTARSAAEANAWQAIAWSPELGIFAAVSDTGGTNSNPMIWQPNYYAGLKAITWSGTLFAIVGISKCYSSPDGLSWTSRTIPTGTYYGVTYDNSLFVAVGAGVIATSPDGITWTARTPSGTNTWQAVIYALNLFIAIASDGANRVATSADGITWNAQSPVADFALSYLDGPASYIDRQQSEVHFIWRDEAGTLHTSGDTSLPQWNLGYLESTDSAPTTRADAYYKIYLLKAPMRLDITDGDKIHFSPYWSVDPAQTIDAMMQISEHLHLSKSPTWYQEIRSIVMFNSAEGGALPSTIERVAAYTPLVSTSFDGNLSPAINNLQAFAQAVDDMTVILGSTDASTTTYTPATAADWDGSADPGDVDNALDQLAERITDVEAGGGAGAGGAFTRLLAANLSLADTQCLVLAGYLNLATYTLTLNGDARLEIL